jgi:hypothetical protein
MSTVVTITAVYSFIGFVLNSSILYLVLSKGRERYHHLFAGILFICAIWDLGITLAMLRNEHPADLIYLGYFVTVPCFFLLPLFFHFTCSYIGCPKVKSTILLWSFAILMVITTSFGLLRRDGFFRYFGRIDDVYRYSWGNIWKGDQLWQYAMTVSIPLYILLFSTIGWLLYQQIRQETSAIKRRHMIYVLASFSAIGLAIIKVLTVIGVDYPLLLPAGMALNDVFIAVIGIAIIKERLFDITVVIKKGALYSLLGAGIILLFSLSEHMLATYVGEFLGEDSFVLHLISIAVVIAILMPIKHRLERLLDGYFSQKRFEF